MPCRTDHIEPTREEREAQHVCQLLVWVNNSLGRSSSEELKANANRSYATDLNTWTAELCAILGSLDDEQIDKIVYNARSQKSRKLADWWENHQEADRAREQQEKQDAADERLRKNTIANLTPEQCRVLGVKSGLNCDFIEVQPGEWYYILENWDAPNYAWNWREYATAYGPFTTQENASDHLDDNHANPGGYREHPYQEGFDLEKDTVLKKLVDNAKDTKMMKRDELETQYTIPLEDGHEDHAGERQEVTIRVGKEYISINPNGYGDCGSANGHGSPIHIERYEGELRLLYWPDINQEDPVIVSLEGAREDRRQGEEDSIIDQFRPNNLAENNLSDGLIP